MPAASPSRRRGPAPPKWWRSTGRRPRWLWRRGPRAQRRRRRLRAGRAFAEMERLAAAGQRFGVVVADPPAFVKSKKDQAARRERLSQDDQIGGGLGRAGRLSAGGLLLASHGAGRLRRGSPPWPVAGRPKRTDLALRRGRSDHPLHPWLPESALLESAGCCSWINRAARAERPPPPGTRFKELAPNGRGAQLVARRLEGRLELRILQQGQGGQRPGDLAGDGIAAEMHAANQAIVGIVGGTGKDSPRFSGISAARTMPEAQPRVEWPLG